MKQEEHRIQCACVRWLRLTHPHLLCFAIPNGGARNAITGSMLKAEGVVAGVPDLFLAYPSGGFSGLFIEMKAGKNKPSELQQKIISKLRSNGYAVEVCYNFDNFVKIVCGYIGEEMATK